MRVISFKSLDYETAKTWFPIALLLVAMITTGSKSLQHLPVALFTVFKNVTIVLIALYEQYVLGIRINFLMAVAFSAIIASSIMGAMNDLAFSLQGYLWMLSNCVVSAWFSLGIRATVKVVGFKDFDSVYYNNVLATPVIAIMSILMDNWNGYLGNE